MSKLLSYEEWEELADQVRRAHPKGKIQNEDGSELPDPTPQDPPIGYRPQPSMFEVIRQMIRHERMTQLVHDGFESPEEADDFEVGDDYDPTSPYEYDFDHVADPAELGRLRDLIDRRERELRGEVDPPSPGTSSVGGNNGGKGSDPPASGGSSGSSSPSA